MRDNKTDVAPGRKATPETKTERNPTAAQPTLQDLRISGVILAGPWAMLREQRKRLTLTGPPVSRSKQRKLGIAELKIGIGYEKRPCSRCREHLWIGPKQLGVLEAAPETEVVCTVCILPDLKAGLKAGTVALTHLDGRGASYYQNGRYFGPPEEVNN